MTYPSNSQSVAHDQIRAFVERILRMKEEARGINDDIREIYAEAKGNGFDKTILGQVVSYVEKRQKDPAAFAERSALFELYIQALGESGDALTRMRVREGRPVDGWDVDENGDGPVRRMVKTRQAIFDALEADGVIPGRDTGRSVYFLHAPSAELLKIGSSDDVRARVRGLQSSSPVALFLLGTIGGGLARELELHEQFSAKRAHGEWFAADEEFLAQVAALLDAADALTHAHETNGLAGPANAGDDRTANTKPAPNSADEAVDQSTGGVGERHSRQRITATEAPPVDTQSHLGSTLAVIGADERETSPAGVEGDEDRPPLSDAAKNALRLRPHCQAALRDEITKCGGYGKVTCFDCSKAHADAEGQTA